MPFSSPKCTSHRRRLPNELLYELVHYLPMAITSPDRREKFRNAFQNSAFGAYIKSSFEKTENKRLMDLEGTAKTLEKEMKAVKEEVAGTKQKMQEEVAGMKKKMEEEVDGLKAFFDPLIPLLTGTQQQITQALEVVRNNQHQITQNQQQIAQALEIVRNNQQQIAQALEILRNNQQQPLLQQAAIAPHGGSGGAGLPGSGSAVVGINSGDMKLHIKVTGGSLPLLKCEVSPNISVGVFLGMLGRQATHKLKYYPFGYADRRTAYIIQDNSQLLCHFRRSTSPGAVSEMSLEEIR